ncbi:ABC transporter permease [Eisenbergiella porci]|uniref:ABC transporter permease n=1 Tax=Eisenbergiella porci TaxID=2652274 RepID=UPI002A82E9D3|nr:ABC transporter permease subunit [Eisenbergiella porci]
MLSEEKKLLKRKFLITLKRQRMLQIFAWAGLVYILIFNYAPMAGILVAFKKFSIKDGFMGIFTNEWVGLKYFIEFFNDYMCWPVIKNTLIISLLKILASFPAPILLAIMITEVKNRPFKKFVQAVSYLPYFISWVIVAGILTAFFSQSRGLVSEFIIKTGISDKGVSFLTDPGSYYQLAVWTSIWKSTGWWSIIFLAAISGIDPGLYEAAMVDGAGRLKRIWHITLPGILPAIVTVLILSVGSFLGGGMMGGNFDQTMMLGNKLNASASEIIQTYAFKTGMVDLRFNYATAIDLMQSIISVILIFATNAVSKKITETGLF